MSRKIVGLFGVVGTGKSTISHYLQTKNWEYINLDQLGHVVLEENSEKIIQLFGTEICNEINQIDRKKLGQVVFSSQEKLHILMNFSYPIIVQKTKQLLDKNINNTIIEGALFYKIAQQIPYTAIWYVEVEHSLLIERLQQRGHDIEWIHNVLHAQQEIITHKSMANNVINNNSNEQELYHQIDRLI